MPNASASFDADFGTPASARRRPARKPRRGSASRGRERLFSLNRVARYGAIVISATVGIGIVANALLMQHGPHPAPLFAAAAPDPAALPSARPGVARAGLPKPAPVATADDEAAPAPARASRAAAGEAMPREQAVAPAPRGGSAIPRGDDPIARLIGGAPAAAPRKAESKATDGRTTAAAQQALGKLGFPVKAGGSAATRKAVEAFEKSRHLPVKGELSRHLLRVLAAESGVRID